MINFILFIVAIVLFVIIAPIWFIYSLIDWIIHPSKLWRKARWLFIGTAIAIDQLGNVICGKMFNDILITKDWYKFGDEDETISSCIWKNKKLWTLKPLWKILYLILDFLDPQHSEKAIEDFK